VGRRLSTAAYDFDESSGAAWESDSRTLRTSGSLGPGSTVSVDLTLAAESPTNPYRHRYHNEHNDPEESFQVTRTLVLTFDTVDPQADSSGNPRPDWATWRLAGTYAETLAGLHRDPLHVSGTFTLQRVSDLADLNP
jgi:hypothetical protein